MDLIVGPNGAGKTTLYERLILPDRPGLPFVNADRIAAERFGDDAEQRSYEAAQIAGKVRDALIEARLDFCTETVFSHPSKLDLITNATNAGYDVVLHVVVIPLVLSGPRVRSRAAQGGHSVSESKLSGRYERLWPLVVNATSLATHCTFWDNSLDTGPTEIASFRFGLQDYPPNWPTWAPETLRKLV